MTEALKKMGASVSLSASPPVSLLCTRTATDSGILIVQYPRLLRISGRSSFKTPGPDAKICRITLTLSPHVSANSSGR
jgi:hypothetical protein